MGLDYICLMNGASQTGGPGRDAKEHRGVNKIHPKVLGSLRSVPQVAECPGVPGLRREGSDTHLT